jgi:hypothetical protein
MASHHLPLPGPSTLPCNVSTQSLLQKIESIARSNACRHIGVGVLLFVSIWFVYRSSVAHAPRSDQWSFLLDTIDQHGFVDTFSRTYSYNRMREVGPGDYQLFRPVLFALLSAEKALFGNNFAAWQWVGIVLHFLAAYLALQVMLQMQRLVRPSFSFSEADEAPSPEHWFLKVLPYALALFFAMNFAVVEIVILSHINGYILFLVLVLGGLLLLLHYWAMADAAWWTQALLVMGGWAVLLLAAFTHELGQLFAVPVGLVMALTERAKGRWGRGVAFIALFAGILPVYQAVNRMDQTLHADARPELTISTIAKQIPSAQTFEHAARYVLFTTVQPFFPSCAKWSFAGERLEIQEPGAVAGNYRRGGPMLIASFVVVGAGLLLAARGLSHLVRRNHQESRNLILLPVSLFALHLALTVFGRMNMRPSPRILSINSYYTYVPLLALLLGLNLLWSCAPARARCGRIAVVPALYMAFFAGLAVSILYSGEQVCAINVAVKNELRPFHASAQWLAEFASSHEREPDFSFAFDPASYEEMDLSHGVPLYVILFKKSLNNQTPKYLVSLRGSKCSAVECAGEERRRPVFPDLVKVGISYNFFYFDGTYYGVLGDEDGFYCPGRADYSYLITDTSLEGAMRQAPAKLAEREKDRNAWKLTRSRF